MRRATKAVRGWLPVFLLFLLLFLLIVFLILLFIFLLPVL